MFSMATRLTHRGNGALSVSDIVAVEYSESSVDHMCVHEQHHTPHTVTAWSFTLGHHTRGESV